jgi:hypothetical protein
MITLCTECVFGLIVVVVCLCTLCLKSYVRMRDKQNNEERFEKTDNKKTRRERGRGAKETEYKKRDE